jgi:hypothetical protein
MLPDAHAVWARVAGVLSRRLRLMRRRIAAHRSSRSVIWALRKAMPTLEAVKFGNKPANDILRPSLVVGINLDINISSTPWSMQSGRDRTRGRSTLHICLYPQSAFSGEISTIRPWSYMRVRLFPRGAGSERSRNLSAKLIARSHRLQRALTSGPIHYLFCDRPSQMCCFLRASTTDRAILR